jgi:YegS/Rv2252/BmrU family lipid kinase
LIIIYNPVAGRRRIAALWRVVDVLIANGLQPRIAETQSAGHATVLAREAAAANERIVVAAGGDGTIAEVAAGLIGTGSSLGIIPLGTANVLAHELGLSGDAKAQAAALAFGRTRTLWPGVAEGPDGDRVFVQMLGVGLDAQVVHRVSHRLKRAIGRQAYTLQTLREIGRYDYRPIRVTLDGVATEAASIVVSKGRFYGGSYTLAPQARSSEPGFSVALFRNSGARAAIGYGAALVLDRLGRAHSLEVRHAQRIEILGGTQPAQADGDPAGMTPIAIRDASASLPVIVH